MAEENVEILFKQHADKIGDVLTDWEDVARWLLLGRRSEEALRDHAREILLARLD